MSNGIFIRENEYGTNRIFKQIKAESGEKYIVEIKKPDIIDRIVNYHKRNYDDEILLFSVRLRDFDGGMFGNILREDKVIQKYFDEHCNSNYIKAIENCVTEYELFAYVSQMQALEKWDGEI